MKIKFSTEKCDSWKIVGEKLLFLSSVSYQIDTGSHTSIEKILYSLSYLS